MILISAGEPHFGRETRNALILPSVVLTKEGSVVIGTLLVKGYQDLPLFRANAAKPPSPAPK